MGYYSDISLVDTLMVMLAAIFTAALAEGLSWLLIYRTEDYKQLAKSLESLTKQLDKEKEKIVAASKQKIQEKRISKADSQLKTTNQQLSASKMKSTMIIALFMIAFMSTLSSTYHGVVVAKLPFVPFSMLQGITHRNLPGDDMTDCSMIFIYLLTSYLIRNNIQKYFGFSPRTSFNMWEPPSSKYN
jgi:calcium load-activated calcium channel